MWGRGHLIPLATISIVDIEEESLQLCMLLNSSSSESAIPEGTLLLTLAAFLIKLHRQVEKATQTERERERQRERDTERERGREREREGEREREREGERERDGGREGGREGEREGERKRSA